MKPSERLSGAFRSRNNGSEVEYVVLAPSDRHGGKRLPLILPLHGAMSSAASLDAAMGTTESVYARNSVYGVLRSEKDRIRGAGLAVFFDCGRADEFGLHDGALYLHGVLGELGIEHEFDSVVGAGHADAAAAGRQAKALRFLGEAFAKQPHG